MNKEMSSTPPPWPATPMVESNAQEESWFERCCTAQVHYHFWDQICASVNSHIHLGLLQLLLCVLGLLSSHLRMHFMSGRSFLGLYMPHVSLKPLTRGITERLCSSIR